VVGGTEGAIDQQRGPSPQQAGHRVDLGRLEPLGLGHPGQQARKTAGQHRLPGPGAPPSAGCGDPPRPPPGPASRGPGPGPPQGRRPRTGVLPPGRPGRPFLEPPAPCQGVDQVRQVPGGPDPDPLDQGGLGRGWGTSTSRVPWSRAAATIGSTPGTGRILPVQGQFPQDQHALDGPGGKRLQAGQDAQATGRS
jgi:hypothetical protein